MKKHDGVAIGAGKRVWITNEDSWTGENQSRALEDGLAAGR